jgi:outer membrane protein TolC
MLSPGSRNFEASARTQTIMSLELARRMLRENQVRVKVGLMARLDIVEAEAEVARNEEAAITAESTI